MTRWTLATLAGVAATLCVASSALAAPGPFDAAATWPMQSKYCDQTAPIVLWVTRTVTNQADSGLRGNAWSIDKYSEEILVRRVGYRTYCAAVRDFGGAFATFGGLSPGGGGFVNAGVSGTFFGAYKTLNFRATFSPLAPTSGWIGVFDHACDAAFDCPGAVRWRDLYFTNVDGWGLDYWHWVYDGGLNGMWINRSVGSSGDILG